MQIVAPGTNQGYDRMKTKILSLLIALAVCAGTISAEKVKIGDLYYNLNAENLTAELTYLDFYSNTYTGLTSVDIPSSVTHNSQTYSVTSIGAQVFYNCALLTSVIIPGSVTSIGDMSFMSCSSLTSITIPEGVTSIGTAAFSYCTSLTAFSLSSTVTSVGDGVFGFTDNLASVVYNEHVFVFLPRSHSGSYSIPEGIESIVGSAFHGCSSLTEITIPGSVKSIGRSAFNGCSSLSSVICKCATPPELGKLVFESTPSSMQIGVRCGAWEAYKSQWSDFASQMYILSAAAGTASADTLRGSVSVLQTTCDTLVTATAYYGYRFAQWTDGNTDNPRTIDPLEDITYTAEFGLDTFAVVVKANQPGWGTTSADTAVLYQDQIAIAATANYGYHFAHWADSVTDNPRTVTVMGDTAFTAVFAKNTYTIADRSDSARGTIAGETGALYLDEVQLTAVAKYGYHFTQWSDGVTDNPRTIVLTCDTAFTAEFAVDQSGTCGDDNALTWTYDADSRTLVISGSGALCSNYTYGVESPSQAEQLIISEGVTGIGDRAFAGMGATVGSLELPGTVTAIGDYAFAGFGNRTFNKLALPNTIVRIGAHAFEGASYLTDIYFGAVLEQIGDSAFFGCKRVKEMTCLAEITPEAGTDALTSISSLATLYVPNEHLLDYQIDDNWNRFQLQGIGATEATVTGNEAQVETNDSTATITWPTSDAADSYTLVITKDGAVICRLTFNAQGQLIGIAYAPSRDGQAHAPAATLTAGGLQFTVTGLESGITYGYRVEARSGDTLLVTYTGEFEATDMLSGMDHAVVTAKHDGACKFILNGQLLIFLDGRTYTVHGLEMK